jgi:NADPH:quinone reductase-like Zn-dependent oxidoreductase
MPALQLIGFGDPAEVVTLVAQPALVAGRDEVVVALEAATVHPSDIHLIRGTDPTRRAVGFVWSRVVRLRRHFP